MIKGKGIVNIGDKIKIKTKNGIVEKYFSYYDSETKIYYFMDNRFLMPARTNFGNTSCRGTAHSIKNIILD